MADSTIRNVPLWQLKENLDSDEEDVIIRRHPGATADEMTHFMKDSLQRFRPNNLIIFGGCNDISRAFKDKDINEWKIAEYILQMAQNGKQMGCQKIFISSVLVRWGKQYDNVIIRVNEILRRVCGEEGFFYLDHSDVTTAHLCGDGLHPNSYGTVILKMNILSCFNSFNPYLSSFYDFYEESVL